MYVRIVTKAVGAFQIPDITYDQEILQISSGPVLSAHPTRMNPRDCGKRSGCRLFQHILPLA
jgi:hypothetical protein